MIYLNDRDKNETPPVADGDGMQECAYCEDWNYTERMIACEGIHLCDLDCLSKHYDISKEVIKIIKEN